MKAPEPLTFFFGSGTGVVRDSRSILSTQENRKPWVTVLLRLSHQALAQPVRGFRQ
jgi:hypothetical protein